MRCPKCASPETKVIDTRSGKNETSIRRRRSCVDCTHRFSTVEEVLREDLVVIKRDGSRQQYDRTRVYRGLRKALEKRPIEESKIEEIVQQVTNAIQSEYDTEVPAQAIGEAIMSRLKLIDQIAYVRFASVYKDFHDISQLAREITQLKNT